MRACRYTIYLSYLVSVADLRNASLTEDMFKGSSSIKDSLPYASSLSLLEEDDKESLHSASATGEYFKSTTLGQKKRRMGERRLVKTSIGENGGYVVPQKRTYKKSGKITFTTQYVEEQKTFEVHVLRVFDLAAKRDVAEINPYLVPGKKQKQSTKHLKSRKEPFFNEKILFNDLEVEDFNKFRLKLKVYIRGRLKKNELLGEVDIALSSIDLKAKETFNIDLFYKKIRGK